MRVHFIQHVSFEHPGYLVKWVEERGHSSHFTTIFSNPVFPGNEAFDVLIILGGPMGVYEEERYPWLKTEKDFIRQAIDGNKKVLGICLGSQLVAECLGAKVYPHTHKEIGWWPVTKIETGALPSFNENLPDSFVSFHWHGDTFDLPAKAIHLFATDICQQQGFIYGTNIAALQFHPEADTDLIKEMISHERAELIPAAFVQSEEAINQETASRVISQKQWLFAFMDWFIDL